MIGEAIAFYMLAAITLLSGVVVVSSPNIVHSAVALVPAFLGVTGIYILLNAEFVAGVQVLIYAGAITVLILFVIMLTEGGTGLRLQQRNEQGTIGAVVAAAVAALLIAGATNLLKATRLMLAALSINSMPIRMATPLRRVTTAKSPSTKTSALSTR